MVFLDVPFSVTFGDLSFLGGNRAAGSLSSNSGLIDEIFWSGVAVPPSRVIESQGKCNS